jgi:hypothetical protein
MAEKRAVRSSKETAIKRGDDAGGITVHTGAKAKDVSQQAKAKTERVNAAKIAAEKAAADAQHKKNQAEAKKKKLSPLDIAMGRR